MTSVTASETPAGARGASASHLEHRLTVLEARVRHLVAVRRADDPGPDDPLRGLYLPDERVDWLLARDPTEVPSFPVEVEEAERAVEHAAAAAEADGAVMRLRELARRFGLDPLDVELLLVAVAPDLDARFERFYGYLNDDVSRRRATVGLALELCGIAVTDPFGRSRLAVDGPLVDAGLLIVEEPQAPFLTRSLRVPDRVTAHLLGDDRVEAAVRTVLAGPQPRVDALPGCADAFTAGADLCYVRRGPGSAATAAAAAALGCRGTAPVVVDLASIEVTGPELVQLLQDVVREARLLGAGLVAGPVDPIVQRDVHALRVVADAPCPVVLHGGASWDPHWAKATPVLLDGPAPTKRDVERLWADALQPSPLPPAAATAVAAFRLEPEQILRAAAAARLAARIGGRQVGTGDLQAAARAQSSGGLARLSRRLVPSATWDDLVLPDDAAVQLAELCARVRHRDVVLDAWKVGRKASQGRGVTALFAGDSGTGKTLSAEVVAHDLGVDLYVIDLSTIVDKYVGETEKNLDRVFSEADRVNGVLLFDEADALFGKRGEVTSAHDRYANVEVAFLLQRMEQFEGIAILTTNLRANVDAAFTRRLDAIIDFPRPEAHDRRRLWSAHLRPPLERTDDVDIDFLAEAFELSGGEIRNITVAAAYAAAAAGRPVEMVDLVRATAREYRKLGRLCVASEFGRYHGVVADVPRAGP